VGGEVTNRVTILPQVMPTRRVRRGAHCVGGGPQAVEEEAYMRRMAEAEEHDAAQRHSAAERRSGSAGAGGSRAATGALSTVSLPRHIADEGELEGG
jgi:hypothetical protein